MAETAVYLRYQGIDNDGGGAKTVRRPRRLSDDDGGVGMGRGIGDASKGSDTTAEAEGYQRWD